MDNKLAITPVEFAILCNDVAELHEASWDHKLSHYSWSWEDCAEYICWVKGVDAEWAWIAQFILWTGYSDVHDWCERQLTKFK